MSKNKIQQYQGANGSWFIKVNNQLICGSKSKKWSDVFLEFIQSKNGKL